MEGKESRFGIGGSVLAAVTTSNGATGSYNSMHDSYTPVGGLVTIVNMLSGEVVFGGLGTGLYSLVLIALVGLFVAGLMIGRTPEYLGKQVTVTEMKLIALYAIIAPLTILPLVAVALVTDAGLAGLTSNKGPHGLSEILVAYTTSMANNGQNFAGLSANTPFYNITTALAMLAGRFGLAIPALALAGRFACQPSKPVTAGTLPTDTPLFAGLTIATVLIVGALSYLPVLALGPLVEHLGLRLGNARRRSTRLPGHRQSLQRRQADAQIPELLLGELPGAARDDLPSSLGEGQSNRALRDRGGEVAQGPQHPQAHRDVRPRVEADLVECRVDEPIESRPRNADAEEARRIVAQGFRLFPGGEADQDPAQLVHAIDGGAGVVHRGRDRAQRDVDDLEYPELHVLLERPGRAEVEGPAQFRATGGGQSLSLRDHQQRHPGRNEVPDPPNDTDDHPVGLRQRHEPVDVDEADVARDVARDRAIAPVRLEQVGFRRPAVAPGLRHEPVDDRLCFGAIFSTM